MKTLIEQARTRAATKMKYAAASTGQGELFESLYEMAPDELTLFLANERRQAEKTLLELTPKAPNFIRYEKLWPQVLLRHVIRLPDVNKIAGQLRTDRKLFFPDWEKGKRVPQQNYRLRRA